MGLFDKINGPVLLKKGESAQQQLAALQQLLLVLIDAKAKEAVHRDIAAVQAGIYGENAVLYELQNSHMPMYILHDLYFEYADQTAQIDFMVVTRKRIFIVECKNLYGDITINHEGDFVRTEWGKREGIYSPINQGRRHLELIKDLRCKAKGNLLSKELFKRYFYDNYRSVVVLANPRTVLNIKYATYEIKEQVIRADRLVEYIKKVNAEPNATEFSENEMTQLAEFYLSKHITCSLDYTQKYRLSIEERNTASATQIQLATALIDETAPACPNCGATMVKRTTKKDIPEAKKEFWGCPNYPKCRGIINIKTMK